MTIMINESFAPPEVHASAPAVTVSAPMQITVGAGQFTISGQAYEFVTDQVADIAVDPLYEREIFGCLVRDAGGDAHLLIDEQSSEFPGIAYAYGVTYFLLARLFCVHVLAGASDLGPLEIMVHHVVAPPSAESGRQEIP
jgi:hypothetical protein